MDVQVALEHSANGLRSIDTGRRGLSPFVKWAGGKGSIIGHLLPYVPSHLTNYYEPFVGGGAVFLAICSRTTHFNAYLSDVNGDLINAYRVIEQRPEELITQLSALQSEYYLATDKKDYFYEKRAWQPETDVELAARLIFLNKTCYNGLYRVNSKGQFNVPFGAHKKPKILHSDAIRSTNQVLRKTRAHIRRLDYKDAVGNCKKGDFVYFDPPYDPTSKTSSFTSYSPGRFSENDQVELAELFSLLVKRGCKVLLSNSDTPLTRELYSEFTMNRIRVPRPINCIGTGRSGFKELIVFGQ